MGTINELIDLAVQAETNAETLYDRISQMFITYPDVARFWARYADEEAGHARWMENLRSRLDPQALAQPANDEVFDHASRVVKVSLSALTAGVHDLQDAWNLANEMEHGETNVIFEFLINHFSNDELTRTFLRTQLRDHLTHLMIDFPTQFKDVDIRRSVKAQPVPVG